MNAQSITNLAYEPINNKYSIAKYGDLNVIMDTTNGYINATKLCSDGGKLIKNWMQNNGNKELIQSFEVMMKSSAGIPAELLINNMSGSYELRGTYVHPNLITHIASWVSPLFAFKVSEIVNNFLVKEIVREKDIIISNQQSSIDELKDMIKKSDKRREDEHEENKKILQRMTDQNEKTHQKLDKADNANEDLQITLDVVNTRLEIVVDEIVKPSKCAEVHEQFVAMKLNDPNSNYLFKVACSQNRGIVAAKTNILKKHPNATVFLEITPSPNSKNLLHNLKDVYGTGKDAKLKIFHNYISLLNGTLEYDFCNMINKVVEDAKNLGISA